MVPELLLVRVAAVRSREIRRGLDKGFDCPINTTTVSCDWLHRIKVEHVKISETRLEITLRVGDAFERARTWLHILDFLGCEWSTNCLFFFGIWRSANKELDVVSVKVRLPVQDGQGLSHCYGILSGGKSMFFKIIDMENEIAE